MPPESTRLVDEGVVIPPTYLFRGGKPRWQEIRELLERGPWPSRAIDENLADLRAAVAANTRGVDALLALAAEHGAETVQHYMDALEESAARHVEDVIESLHLPGTDGREARVEERLDDGASICVTVRLDGSTAEIDFTGSSATHPGNLNATPAIVGSAVLYVLRLLLDEPLPLNDGLTRCVTVRLPEGSIVNPGFPSDPNRCAAVAGGNVETSQRIVDTLLKAFGVVACSQGTMNNVLFGTSAFGYYETVGGGCGAGPGFHGASAVHSHMTNTRITDAEVLEHRYPVLIERFGVRRGSGGEGRWRGGDGIVRSIRFLEEVELSVLSQHRLEGPYGLEGGEPGAPGRQRVVRADGEVVELAGIDGCKLRAGDRLILETPGGGGYGRALDPKR
jgi:5-oxoprolinase (ATP-hydrolysing)